MTIAFSQADLFSGIDNIIRRLKSQLSVHSLPEARSFITSHIPITDINQYVPLFTAYWKDSADNLDEIMNSRFVREIPTFYEVPIPLYPLFSSKAAFNIPSRSVSLARIQKELFNGTCTAALGHNFTLAITNGDFILPWFYGRIGFNGTAQSCVEPEYEDAFFYDYWSLRPHTVFGNALLLIRAKYVPLVKTAIYTEQAISLPIGALKLLRVRKELRSHHTHTLLDDSGLLRRIDKGLIPVEYVSNNEMMAYLNRPKSQRSLQDQLEGLRQLALTDIGQLETELPVRRLAGDLGTRVNIHR